MVLKVTRMTHFMEVEEYVMLGGSILAHFKDFFGFSLQQDNTQLSTMFESMLKTFLTEFRV